MSASKGKSRRAALRMSVAEITDIQLRLAGTRTAAEMRDAPLEKGPRSQKYGNEKVIDGDLRFDSKAEHRRWIHLKWLEKAGEITNLKRQVPFELIPAQPKPSGGHERATVYIADFTYEEGGVQIVEDVKGAVTPEYRLKRKLMLWRHGVEVREVRS